MTEQAQTPNQIMADLMKEKVAELADVEREREEILQEANELTTAIQQIKEIKAVDAKIAAAKDARELIKNRRDSLSSEIDKLSGSVKSEPTPAPAATPAVTPAPARAATPTPVQPATTPTQPAPTQAPTEGSVK